ncbi:vitellogenic carboxypeptidase-like protein [Fistulifera solaris]|uniref:Carboxypeptidase n=1 Tax=Fistulifera solaris TaxID=1519565 RepID=A0A1Z5KMM2_FISSO|nr:vitellogenic carboxypeptidase-like protein [Fistulifera solaris]|eukprot:GAX27526.1 vitellogenic carboxypeptidase-like protein [Fistulifera solaris]
MMNFTKEEFFVQGLENIQAAYAEFDGHMYAGMLPADNGDRINLQTMFWLFEPTTQEIPNSMILWLNGGPGCSSFNCGVMMEHSPVTQPLHAAGYCCLQPDPELHVNPHAWTKGTTVLYVEHPIGTGFSHGTYPSNETEASADLDAFLQNFLAVFDHLQEYEFFVMGESYAGMFVPSVAREIHLNNKKNKAGRIPIKLGGAALGNGWIDGMIQGPATIDYSWWHGLIDQPTRDALHDIFQVCMSAPEKLSAPFHPYTVQDDCGIMWGILQAAGNPNAYDITTWDPNVDQVTFTSEAFFNTPQVKELLHVLNPEHIWHGCQAGSGRRRQLARQLYMDNDRPLSVVPYIAELLDADIPIVVYNGDRDMTTNMVGTELCLNGMKWKGADNWMDAPRGLWKVNDYPAGWAKEYKSLQYVVVYNSGHMVPYNVPESAYDLLKRLLTKKSFIDDEAPVIRAPKSVSDHMSMSKHMAGTTTTTTMSLSAPALPSGMASNVAGEGFTMMSLLVAVAIGMMLGGLWTPGTTPRSYEDV